MKKTSGALFEQGEWCPLFGALSYFKDEPRNSTKNLLIDIIYEARECWGIGEPDYYNQSCPEVSEIKFSWGISPQQIKDTRLIYNTFMCGSMYSSNADKNPSQENQYWLESRMSGIAGVQERIEGIHLFALLAICEAGSALAGILYYGEAETDHFILKALCEGQALIARANEVIRHNEIGRFALLKDQVFEHSRSQAKKGERKAYILRSRLQPRNEYIIKEAKVLKEKHPRWGDSSIAKFLCNSLSKNPSQNPDFEKYPIGEESIRKIISGADI